MKVLHVITGLNQGGAERQLTNLLVAGTGGAVFSILKPGVMQEEIKAAGVPLYSGNARRAFSMGWLSALRRAIREYQPNLIMGWMYHGNLAASAACFLGHRVPVIWNVRHSVHDLSLEKMSTQWVIRAGAWLSRHPAKIIYNSATAADQHKALGYLADAQMILPNGFNLDRFKPDTGIAERFRAKIGVSETEILLGVVGRSHPMKNHVGWVRAFQQLVENGFHVRCVMMGTGVDVQHTPLDQAIRNAEMEAHVIRLRSTSAPEHVYPGLDLLVMPSLWGEGFPNVVGEAMACGVPAVVNPVGDAARVVKDTGFVCDSTAGEDLVHGVSLALSHRREGLAMMGQKARLRMESCYSIGAVVARYEELCREVCDSWTG